MNPDQDHTVRIGREKNPGFILLSTPDGRTVEIRDGDVVGRNAVGKEVFEKQEKISRRHAEFVAKDGRWFIRDLNSSNGTFLEGQKITPGQLMPLKDGQTIKLSPVFRMTVNIENEDEGKTVCIPLGGPQHTEVGRKAMVVLFADLKGSVDFFQEMGTIIARNWIVNLYKVLSSVITSHNGRHLKNIGDAILAIFEDPVEAARAAVQMQKDLRKHNEEAAPADRYYVRIGMNIGPVLFENNDVFGNCVNIAARVQAVAPPEHIFITRSLYDLIKDSEGIEFIFIGDEQLKGVKELTGIYEIVY